MSSLPALGFGVVAASANLLGAWAVTRSARLGLRVIELLFAFAAGFMLALALVGVVPEALRRDPETGAVVVLLGYLLVHLTQHTVTPHFHFGEETHEHEFAQRHKSWSVLLGLVIHTFFDGIAIASGFLVSTWLGWIIFVAVFLHKIPEGFTVASVMLASGRSRGLAWGSSALLGGATLLGVLVMVITRQAVSVGLPLSAGVTIYVAASDLIPEVNREPGIRMALVVFLGVGFLFVMDHLFHVH